MQSSKHHSRYYFLPSIPALTAIFKRFKGYSIQMVYFTGDYKYMRDVIFYQLIPRDGYEDRGNNCIWSPDGKIMIEADTEPLKIQIQDKSLVDIGGNPLPNALPLLKELIDLMKPYKVLNNFNKDITRSFIDLDNS